MKKNWIIVVCLLTFFSLSSFANESKKVSSLISKGNVSQVVSYFNKNKSQINLFDSKTGNTPLLTTAFYGNIKMYDALIKLGANEKSVNKRKVGVLGFAIAGNKIYMLEHLILRRKVQLNNLASPPLIDAVVAMSKGMMNLLLKNGADINSQNKKHKQTALMYAANLKKNGLPIVKYLLGNGANPFIKNKKGITALKMAKNADIKKILNLKIQFLKNLSKTNKGSNPYFFNLKGTKIHVYAPYIHKNKYNKEHKSSVLYTPNKGVIIGFEDRDVNPKTTLYIKQIKRLEGAGYNSLSKKNVVINGFHGYSNILYNSKKKMVKALYVVGNGLQTYTLIGTTPSFIQAQRYLFNFKKTKWDYKKPNYSKLVLFDIKGINKNFNLERKGPGSIILSRFGAPIPFSLENSFTIIQVKTMELVNKTFIKEFMMKQGQAKGAVISNIIVNPINQKLKNLTSITAEGKLVSLKNKKIMKKIKCIIFKGKKTSYIFQYVSDFNKVKYMQKYFMDIINQSNFI